MEPTKHRSLLELRTELSSGFVWFLTTTILWQVISWGLTLVIARLLTPRDYGLLALAETVIPYILILSTLKVETWLIQKREISTEDESVAQTLLLLLGFLFGIIAFVSADLISTFYQEPALADPFKCFSLIFPLRGIQLVPEARLRRDLKFKILGFANLYIGAARGVLQVILVLLGFQYWSLVLGGVFAEVARAAYLIAYAGTPRRFNFSPEIVKDIWKFGIAAAGATIGWIAYSTSDNIVVGRVFGVEMLGFYAMAYFLMDLPLSKVNTIIAPLVLPYYVQLRDHPKALRKTFLRSTGSLVGVIAPILTGAIVVAPLALPIILGERWRPMILPFQALALVGILRSIPAHTGNLLYALAKPNDVFKVSLLPALTLPPAFILFAHFGRESLGAEYGIIGIYMAWLLLYPVVGVCYSINVACQAAGVSVGRFFKKLIPIAVGSMAIFTSVLAVHSLTPTLNPIARLILEILSGGLTYPLVILVFFKRTFLESIVMLRRLRNRRK